MTIHTSHSFHINCNFIHTFTHWMCLRHSNIQWHTELRKWQSRWIRNQKNIIGIFFVSSTKNSTEIGIIFVWNIMDQAFTAFSSLRVFKFPFFVHSLAQKENNSNSCYSFNQKPQRKIHTPIYSYEITNFPANEWISKCNAIPR